MGLPSQDGMALTTAPYYRSSYVLVYRADRNYGIRSLDDPKLKHLRIGVHLIGNNSPPPAIALAHRGIMDNVVGYNIYGDYRQGNPPLRLIKAVAQGDIDVAIVWGPMAGYFAKHEPVSLTIVPLVNSAQDGLPFAFSIALGVRKGDEVMKARLDAALARKHDAIRTLLDVYNVPQVDAVQQPAPLAFRD
ncbi:bacterial extracellular solute-binding protein, family 3 [mine drainage metagenome]|uniref:Bacterial extracellular solute-binding protein, family 3 n=1 Tax=mine drainage metagenome TaxID=410659 RepID=A0A1J5Q4V9_9ZZZZ